MSYQRRGTSRVGYGCVEKLLGFLGAVNRSGVDPQAVESHRRAAAAIAEGRIKAQIVPIVKQTRKGEVSFDTDEHVKAGTTMESLAKVKRALKKAGLRLASSASDIFPSCAGRAAARQLAAGFALNLTALRDER